MKKKWEANKIKLIKKSQFVYINNTITGTGNNKVSVPISLHPNPEPAFTYGCTSGSR
jgi:hypothetical protein